MPKLFIALDYPDFDQSLSFLERIRGVNGIGMKVGLQLFLSEGEKILHYLNELAYPVFLDLKFNDIPNTVKGALSSIRKYSPYMVNMHISAGVEAIKTARDEVNQWDKRPLLIGVTILTSLVSKDLEKLGYKGIKDLEELVISMSKAGCQAGLDGVVTSNHEVIKIKECISGDFIAVVPGIRIETGGSDQKRSATVEDTISSGADYIVIGRAITQSKDPLMTIESISDKIEFFYVD